MKKTIPVFLIILLHTLAHSQTETLIQKNRVTAPSGLRLRKSPSLSSPKICVIPYGEKVNILLQQGESVTIEDQTGKWTKIFWNNQQGWVFGGLLGTINTVLEGKWKGKYFYIHFIEHGVSTWGFIGGGSGTGKYTYDNMLNKIIFINQHTTMQGSAIKEFEIVKLSYFQLELIALEKTPRGKIIQKHPIKLSRIK